ncbi:MAG: GNAT family N-acetyltransferase, partial [Bacteroides sp.]|nr:GNAT family N-acetyltransferase [Bacteroides sp.]
YKSYLWYSYFKSMEQINTSIMLETDRLRILALFPERFSFLCEDYLRFEAVMGLYPSGYPGFWTEDIRQVMSQLCKQAREYTDHYYWYTNWLIVLKEENKAIGSACFKGEPDEQGEVEIGYGTYPDYQNRGYMTEAVAALCQWALTRERVTAVLAATDPENVPSCKVLEKNGFTRYQGPGDFLFWWRYQ